MRAVYTTMGVVFRDGLEMEYNAENRIAKLHLGTISLDRDRERECV